MNSLTPPPPFHLVALCSTKQKRTKKNKRTRYSVRNIPDKTPVVLQPASAGGRGRPRTSSPVSQTGRSSSSVFFFFFLCDLSSRAALKNASPPHLRAERERRVVFVACDPGETKQTAHLTFVCLRFKPFGSR